jgi:uncharacterized RDD family membrane protein YckC
VQEVTTVVVAEQPAAPVRQPAAPFLGRLAAQVLDWLVTFIIVALFLVAAGLYLLVTSDMARRDPSDQAILTALVIASLSIPTWCVVTLAGFTWRGRSAGKLAMNLRIVARNGSPPGIRRSLLRFVVYAVEVVPLALAAPVAALALVWRSSGVLSQMLVVGGAALLVPAISLLLVLRDRSKRALHDLAAGTTVVAD